jgi:hypothetical protein
LAKFIAKYRQEEERLRAEHKDFVNLISQDFNRNHGHSKSRWKFSHQKKGKGKSVMRTPRKKLLKSPRARVLSDAIVMIGVHKERLLGSRHGSLKSVIMT